MSLAAVVLALVSTASAGDAADKSPKAMNLAFVLLPQVKLPAGKEIERAFDAFAVSGQRLRLRPSSKKSGKPGDPQVLEFELGAGGTAFVSLMPAPVPKGEADAAARYSVSGMGDRWKPASHKAHLVVTAQQAGPAVERLSAFTSLVAAVSHASSAVGIYCGNAGATHDPKFFEDIARQRDTSSRIVLWSGVSIAREADGRLSFLSLGLGQLELPDLLLVVPKGKSKEALGIVFDLLAYAVTRGGPVPEGDTVGRTDSERWPVHYVRSPADPDVKVWRVEIP